jgi:hypothetical protein
MKVRRKSPEGSYWSGVSIAGHSDDMFFGTVADPAPSAIMHTRTQELKFLAQVTESRVFVSDS